MRIALYSSVNNTSLDEISKLLTQMGVEFVVDPENSMGFDLAVSLGGDGTFLSSVRKMGQELIPILGINSGRLGFLSNVSDDDASVAIKHIIEKRYSVEHRTMLEIKAKDGLPADIPYRALNEFTIQKSGTSMVSIDVEADGEKVGSYWADGIIISTPTGSTAYSMSVGGAILSPNCRAFIISPIAPHNLNMRPLVISDSAAIKLRVSTRFGTSALATVDNMEYMIQSGAQFELCRSKDELEVIKLEGTNFYKTIREKLLWGVDPRN